MKELSWMAICLIASGSLSFGQSLTEVAKKEKERRKQNEGVVRVFDDAALSGEDSEPEGNDRPSTIESPARHTPLAKPEDDETGLRSVDSSSSALRSDAERDRAKRAAMDRLESHIRSMSGPARRFVNAATSYQQNCTGRNATNVCEHEINQLLGHAVVVGRLLDEAHTLARKSGIAPGALRDLREKYGLDHQIWDAAVRFAARYGR